MNPRILDVLRGIGPRLGSQAGQQGPGCQSGQRPGGSKAAGGLETGSPRYWQPVVVIHIITAKTTHGFLGAGTTYGL